MPKYFLFAGSTYYPVGGIEDYIGAFDTLEECESELRKEHYDWFNLAILKDGQLEEIASLGTRLYGTTLGGVPLDLDKLNLSEMAGDEAANAQ